MPCISFLSAVHHTCRRAWLILCLLVAGMLLAGAVLAQEEPTFGDSHLDFLRVFNAAQGIDQRWSNRPANSLSMSVPYLTDQVWLEATSFNYFRDVTVGGTLTGWTIYPSEIFNYTHHSNYSNSSFPLQLGANTLSVVSTFPGLPAETYTLTITRLPPSSVTELSGIGLPAGYALSPAFATAVKSYSLNVASHISSLSISPVAREYGTVTINGAAANQPVALQVGANILTLQVTAQDGVSTDSYTLTVNRADPANDPSLASLRLSSYQGTATDAVLDYDSNTVTVSVPYHTSEFTVTATAANVGSGVQLDGVTLPQGQASAAIAFSGNSLTLPLRVSSPDGNSSRQYSLIVNRTPVSSDASLSGLNAQGSALVTMLPGFDPGVSSYSFGYSSVGENSDMPSFSLQASTRHRFATLTINGQPASSGEARTLALEMGDNTVTVEVTAEDGVTRQTYTLLVRRNGNYREALLTDLQPSLGRLSPAFSGAVTDYVLTVPSTAQTVTLTPIGAPSTARLGTIRVNGVVTASGTASAALAVSGAYPTLSVNVTSGDQMASKGYQISVVRRDPGRSADLSGITLSSGRLQPAFVTTTSTYQVAVPGALTTLRVTPQTADGYAGVEVNGTPLSASGWVDVALPPGNSTITVRVTAEDQQQQNTYSLNVVRLNETELASLQLSQGVLQPAFSPAVTSYRALLANSVSALTLQAESGGVLRVNGSLIANGASVSVPLAVGDNTVVLAVSSLDGTQQRDYRLQLTRAADPAQTALLAGFGPGALSSSAYAVSVAAGDIEGDGRVDLLVASSELGVQQLHAYRNTVNAWQSLHSQVLSGMGAMLLTSGDVNGDGKADVVVVGNQVSGLAAVMLGNGDGSFRETTRITLGTFPERPVIADFNGDGRADLVFQSLERLHYLAGDGAGGFAAPVVIELPTFAGYALRRVLSADLNRDGKPDLLLLLRDGRVQVLLGNGDGSFAAQAPSSSTCNSGDSSLVLGDINQDGWVDVVNVDNAGNVSIRLGNGDGSFLAPACFASGFDTRDAFLGDYNEDGVPDLLLTLRDNSDRRLALLPGNGGSFGTPQLMPLRYSASENVMLGLSDAVAGDFDGDGRGDLALVAPASQSWVFLALNRTTPLRSLTLSAGTLEPALSAGVPDYRVAVGRGRTSLEITPELLPGNHRLSINGTPVVSGTASAPLPLQIGENTVLLSVTAASGRVENYRLTVLREQPLTPPLAVTASAGDASARVSFTPPQDDGGNPVLGYTVQVSPAEGTDVTADPLSRQRTITGLRNGTAYTFTVIAHNALGSSLPSAASATVTPRPPLPPAPEPTTPADPTPVAIGNSGTTVVDGSAPVSIGSGAVGGGLTIAGTQPVSLALNGMALQLQASSGTVLSVVAVMVNGQRVPALALTQGRALLSATQAGQVLFSLHGEALLAATADARVQLGNGLLAVRQGRVQLSGNAFAAGPVSQLAAGEQAVLDAAGRILRVRLGRADGSAELEVGAGDSLNPPAIAGLTVMARIPRLAGSIVRLPEGLGALVREALALPPTAVVAQDSDGLLRLPSGWRLLPLGEVLVDERVADGISFTPDGLARLTRNGVVLTLAPAVADLAGLVRDLRQSLAGEDGLTLTESGWLRVRVQGSDYLLRPDWRRLAASASAPAGSFLDGSGEPGGIAGSVRYVDAGQGVQSLYPVFADAAQVCARVLALWPAAHCQAESDGRVAVAQDGIGFRLAPAARLETLDAAALAALPAAARAQGWGWSASGRLYFLFGNERQEASLE